MDNHQLMDSPKFLVRHAQLVNIKWTIFFLLFFGVYLSLFAVFAAIYFALAQGSGASGESCISLVGDGCARPLQRAQACKRTGM